MTACWFGTFQVVTIHNFLFVGKRIIDILSRKVCHCSNDLQGHPTSCIVAIRYITLWCRSTTLSCTVSETLALVFALAGYVTENDLQLSFSSHATVEIVAHTWLLIAVLNFWISRDICPEKVSRNWMIYKGTQGHRQGHHSNDYVYDCLQCSIQTIYMYVWFPRYREIVLCYDWLNEYH